MSFYRNKAKLRLFTGISLRLARKFDEEIRRNGAKTILLMTWERPDSKQFGVTTEKPRSHIYNSWKELGVVVAPVGLAFARSTRGKPELTLYVQDGHPTIEGTYLAACVLYRTIFQKSPVGNPYSAKAISADIRDYLQRIAAENFGMWFTIQCFFPEAETVMGVVFTNWNLW